MVTVLLLAPSLRAQNTLPDHFGPWSVWNPVTQLPSRLEPPAKDLFAESGLEKTEARAYTRDNKSALPLFVTSYTFHDSSGAYEACSFLRQPTGAVDEDMGGKRVVLVGNMVLVVNWADSLSLDDQTLLTEYLQRKADKTPPPPIPDYLPDRDRRAHSEQYALGPIAFRKALEYLRHPEYAVITDSVGFNSGAEAIFARYWTPRDEAVSASDRISHPATRRLALETPRTSSPAIRKIRWHLHRAQRLDAGHRPRPILAQLRHSPPQFRATTKLKSPGTSPLTPSPIPRSPLCLPKSSWPPAHSCSSPSSSASLSAASASS